MESLRQGESAFRVLYDSNTDHNVNLQSLLQKRQNIPGKGTPSTKKAKLAATHKSTTLAPTESAKIIQHYRKQKKLLAEQHKQQMKRTHDFYTNEITELQSTWTDERAALESTISSLRREVTQKDDQLLDLAKRLINTDNQANNYAMLYKASKEDSEVCEQQETKKQSILARLRMEMDFERSTKN